MTQPTRRLTDQVKPHRYIRAYATDIRRTFRKFRLLATLQHTGDRPSSVTCLDAQPNPGEPVHQPDRRIVCERCGHEGHSNNQCHWSEGTT